MHLPRMPTRRYVAWLFPIDDLHLDEYALLYDANTHVCVISDYRTKTTGNQGDNAEIDDVD